jgi:hypothetical protein
MHFQAFFGGSFDSEFLDSDPEFEFTILILLPLPFADPSAGNGKKFPSFPNDDSRPSDNPQFKRTEITAKMAMEFIEIFLKKLLIILIE